MHSQRLGADRRHQQRKKGTEQCPCIMLRQKPKALVHFSAPSSPTFTTFYHIYQIYLCISAKANSVALIL